MTTLLHRAETRGRGDYGWLTTRYSFSFGEWYEPRRMGYGALRVLNDDVIAPGGTFPMHGHKDFEIITIPLAGAVTHEDSLGNQGVVRAGEVQVMSAGTGVVHSERNASASEVLELFQIWIAPRAVGLMPRYETRAFAPAQEGSWQLVVSSDAREGSLMIAQDAQIARAGIAAGGTLTYTPALAGAGIYVLVVEGALEVAGVRLERRDALAVDDMPSLELAAVRASSVLVIEVPMH